MNNVVRMSIVDPNDATRHSVKSLLLGVDRVWLEAECSRYEFFTDVVSQTNPDLAIVVLDSNPQAALALIAELSQTHPTCSVLCVSGSTEGSLILQAMRNGAKEFLNSPLQLDDFMSALDRIVSTSSGKSGKKARRSQVISIVGVGGGVGCTSLAINLGCTFAQDEECSVVIIDLDLALGDADVWLDIIPDYTIQDVADNITRLDYSLLKRSLTQHDCGAFLLPRPVHVEPIPPMNPDQLQRVIALLKATFTHLVIDLSKSYTPLDLAAMQSSDTILMVTQLDLPSLRNVVRMCQFLDEQDLGDKLKIVVNRIGLEDSQISLSKALDTIGREVFWQIPNDYSTMVESRNNGVPLLVEAPRSKVTRAIEQLAEKLDSSLTARPLEQELEKPKRKLFSFLGGK
ncbi:MAG: pilus assembly protein CpaE [Planctomycetaceae bacterium]|nr:pilus assembly protein CpaE [Planctomycetaceae bacterium]